MNGRNTYSKVWGEVRRAGYCVGMISPEPFAQEGYDLMGATFEVYKERGFGFSEEIYQESLEMELELRSIPFVSKMELACFYKGRLLRKTYAPDLLVSDALVVELKAVGTLLPEHEAQLLNYLRIAQRPIGYLVNFGNKDSLQWKRMILSKYLRSESAKICGN
jgi:GxxExxY protein